MKVIAKYVTVEAVKDKQVLTPLFPHDFMLDGDDFTDAYKGRSVSNG